ncbi:hypothetical protein PGB90_006350 [Kerria lacca]
MSDFDEEMLFLTKIIEAEKEEEKAKQKCEIWVHEINAGRPIFREHYHRFPRLLRDCKKFINYFRTSHEKFYELLEIIKLDIEKKNTEFRLSILSEERLAICLRQE